eukprot:IDg16994t1
MDNDDVIEAGSASSNGASVDLRCMDNAECLLEEYLATADVFHATEEGYKQEDNAHDNERDSVGPVLEGKALERFDKDMNRCVHDFCKDRLDVLKSLSTSLGQRSTADHIEIIRCILLAISSPLGDLNALFHDNKRAANSLLTQAPPRNHQEGLAFCTRSAAYACAGLHLLPLCSLANALLRNSYVRLLQAKYSKHAS